MSEENPEIEPEEPRSRLRRRRRRDARTEAEEASAASGSAAEAGDTPEVEPEPEDVDAEEAASDVMIEADEEAEEPEQELADDDLPAADEPEEEPPAQEPEQPSRRRRRRRGDAEEPAAPARRAPTRRRRSQRDPSLPPPVVRAQARYVRSSARKARLVCDHLRGKSVDEARAILAHTPRAIARDWSKLLESAVANAEHNHELVGEDLYVKAIHADEGPTIKRYRPRAMGRATKIRKRTSHLTILLTPKD